ncbi:hypothetical protein ASE01_08010 [Nocardioides sp. Root190]|uniref:hypothetical protein n=1 Tax=Nocardioides sp. Root190 TaxID=1736488 RepID=UPI0006F9DAF1|nr:hypothetical protein [Nocardioides sp. Root190]KRB78094.1 hypothetical protein ASE01_08010 [Nocardioides sp. Root190]
MSDPTPELDGTWYVVRTSLSFWRRRTDPTISYTLLPDGRMTDTVLYRRRGRDRVVLGLDSPATGGGWTWRGVGATRLLTSRWEVVAHEGPWLVTLFERTPFTAAGLDLCWRRPDPDPDELARVLDPLGEMAAATPYVDRLFAPVHDRRT